MFPIETYRFFLKDGDANSPNVAEFSTAFCHYIFSSVNRD